MTFGVVWVAIKIGPDRFGRFDVFWIQRDEQTDKQSIYLDCAYWFDPISVKLCVSKVWIECVWSLGIMCVECVCVDCV